MRADLGLSYLELGWVVAAFGLARLLVDLPAGSLGDRWNPRSVLLAAFATSAVGSALGVLAATSWQVAGVRLLIGVGSSIAQAMLLAWLVGGAGRLGRGRIMARGEALFSISGLVTPFLSGLLAQSLGWRVAFALGLIAASAGFLAVLLFTRPATAAQSVGFDRRTRAGPPRGWRDLRFGGPVLLAAYLATFVIFFCRNGLFGTVLPVLGADEYGLEPVQIGLIFSCANAVSILAVLLGGRLGDRFGRAVVLAPGLALLLVAQLLLFVVVNPLTYVVVCLLQGLAFMVNPLPPSLVGDALPAELRGRGIAVYRAMGDAALLAAPPLLGLALQTGGFVLAEAVGVVLTLGALIIMRVTGRP
jgi:MFS family permease